MNKRTKTIMYEIVNLIVLYFPLMEKVEGYELSSVTREDMIRMVDDEIYNPQILMHLLGVYQGMLFGVRQITTEELLKAVDFAERLNVAIHTVSADD